jgi:hypothetical protein
VSTCLHPFDQKKFPCQDFLCLSCVCFWHQWVFNSNNLGVQSRILYSIQEGGPVALPLLVAGALRFGWRKQLSKSANELGLQNFLTTWIKGLWRQEPQWPCKFCAQTKTINSTGWPSNVLVVRILEAV